MKKTILVLNSAQAVIIRTLLRDYLRSMGDADNFLTYSLDELIDYFDSLAFIDEETIKQIYNIINNNKVVSPTI